MALKVYNSLTRKTEEFIPIEKDLIKIYSCGPTVYNYPHIGNYRAYIFSDILRRTLEYMDYGIIHIMNITDIDDKTIRDSQLQNKTLKEFTEFYTEEFFKDLDNLHIRKATKYPKASEYINEMVKLIRILMEKGFAYKSEDGSVYFDIKKDKEYGKLAHLNKDELRSNASGRIKNDEYEKENISDFALWKMWDESDGSIFWETSLGKGRPGWHIECSAMSMENLGEHFDIHTGGRDNLFPHHENEIAQSECSTGEKFVNYWLHNEWLLVDGKKMSKSANNFYTLRDLHSMGFDSISFRYLTLINHYRTPLNFTKDSLAGAQTALKRLKNIVSELPNGGSLSSKYNKKFIDVLENDFNTPQTMALVWDLVKDTSVPDEDKKFTLLKFDEVLGLGLDDTIQEIIPENVINLFNTRNIARENKDWVKSDELRDEIQNLGYEVKDTNTGSIIKKL